MGTSDISLCAALLVDRIVEAPELSGNNGNRLLTVVGLLLSVMITTKNRAGDLRRTCGVLGQLKPPLMEMLIMAKSCSNETVEVGSCETLERTADTSAEKVLFIAAWIQAGARTMADVRSKLGPRFFRLMRIAGPLGP